MINSKQLIAEMSIIYALGYVYGKLFEVEPVLCASVFLITKIAKEALAYYFFTEGVTEEITSRNLEIAELKSYVIVMPICTVACRQLGIIGNFGTLFLSLCILDNLNSLRA